MTSPGEFLENEFTKRKKQNPNLSLRAFAKWLKISPAQLSQMISGKRPVTLATIKKISARIELSPTERKKLFSSLLTQKSPEASEKTAQDRQMLKMSEDQFQLIADWHHFAILSLSNLKGARPDPRWIARRLGIGVEQAHKALLRLERMGIIEVKPKFRQVCDPIEAVSEVPSEAIRRYHKQNLSLASEKIETVPVHMRQFQSITLAVNPKQIEQFKLLIDDFLEQAAEIAGKQEGSEVFNCNVQFFPVTLTSEVK